MTVFAEARVVSNLKTFQLIKEHTCPDLRAAMAVAAKSTMERASFILVMVLLSGSDLLQIFPVESN